MARMVSIYCTLSMILGGVVRALQGTATMHFKSGGIARSHRGHDETVNYVDQFIL
jgi:hypothetical protein